MVFGLAPVLSFRVEAADNPDWTSHSSGLRLDLSRGQMTNGANLQLYTPADANNQRWIIKQSGEAYNIISRTNGLYVDI